VILAAFLLPLAGLGLLLGMAQLELYVMQTPGARSRTGRANAPTEAAGALRTKEVLEPREVILDDMVLNDIVLDDIVDHEAAEPAESGDQVLVGHAGGRDAGQQLADLGLAVAAVPTQGADAGELAGLGPAGDGLGVHPEHGRHLSGGEQRLGVGAAGHR
jgi:hypothetical protein